jgi:hypothetical protein
MTRREDRPELADAGRLARKLLGRTVRMARTEDQALRRALLDHLGPNAAYLPMVSSSYPVYEHVNPQVGVDAWLAADPSRTHEVVGITGVRYPQHTEATISDIIQGGPDGSIGSAGVGAPVRIALPFGPLKARPTRTSATASTWCATVTTGWRSCCCPPRSGPEPR